MLKESIVKELGNEETRANEKKRSNIELETGDAKGTAEDKCEVREKLLSMSQYIQDDNVSF